MKKILYTILPVAALSLFIGYSFAETTKPIQDSKKAEQYFETYLEFSTNPWSTKLAVDGKIKNVTIVDVRDEKRFKEGHVPGAINITNFMTDSTNFPGLRKDGYNYIYGYTGVCKLPQIAAKRFASLGYPVKVIVGGFESWNAYKYPVEK